MNPYSPEQKEGKINELSKLGSVFTGTNPILNPYYHGGTEQETEEREEAEEMANTFGLEKDLQAALRKNIGELEPGLKIVDDDRERTVEGGRIDITAEDREGRIVVIELKAGKAKLASIGQIQFYMQSLAEEEQKAIRGILVAGDFDKKVIVAARGISNLELKQYSVSFSFKNH
jgi:RecB family endonuclease NucS